MLDEHLICFKNLFKINNAKPAFLFFIKNKMKKIKEYFKKKYNTFKTKSKKEKILSFLSFITIWVWLLVMFSLYSWMINWNASEVIRDANKEYVKDFFKNQVNIKEFDSYYQLNKNWIEKITLPIDDSINYFEVLKTDITTWKLEHILVYKELGTKWSDYSNVLDKYKKDIWMGFIQTPKKVSLFTGETLWNLIMIIFLWFLIYSMLKMSWIATPSSIKLFNPNISQRITFNDIWWIESQKEEIKDIIETLNNWETFREKGVRPIRWLMLFGPPWTWKTMIAKAIASETWVDLFIANWWDFRSKYFGESAQKVHKSFKQIKKFIIDHKKSLWILFIDEIDTILKSRDKVHSEDATVVNAFLAELDWIEGSTNIIVIGATNYQDNIDEAVLSRFDKKLYFDYPLLAERNDIVNKIFERIKKTNPSVKIKENLDLSVFCKNTQGMSWRDIENVLNEVHNKHIKTNKEIDEHLIQETFSEMVLWKDRKWFNFTEQDKNVIAYHEIWHAVIWYLFWKKVHTVTIIPKGKALWLTWSVDKKEQILKTPDDFLNQIKELLWWRMAEQLFLKQITTGSSNDYERATQLAESYLKDYNFKYWKFQLGYIPKYRPEDIRNLELDKILKKEVNKIISDQEQIVTKLLTKHKKKIEKLVTKIKENEIIFEEDIKNEFWII